MANLRADNLTGSGGRNAIDGSLYFDGTGDYLSIDDSADLELGSGDFTIEGWFYFGNTGSSGTTFWGKWNSPNRSYTFSYVKSTGTYTFGYSTDGSAEVLLTSSALSADINTWVHFAAVRNGSSLKVYRNGISIIDASVGSATFYNATTDLYIGRLQSNTNYDYKGYVSNFRLIKGTALYTANFTPPTEKLTVVPNTVLLCCQDSDNSTQEATGKTITGYGNLQTFDDTELITNGGFVEDLSGWTVAQGTWAWDAAGKAHMTGTSGNSLEQNVTTVVGKRYRLTATVDNTANTGANAGITLGSVLNYVFSDTITTGSKTFIADFTATSTSTLVDLWGGTAVTGYWSNASVKLLDPPKAPKVIPPVGVDEGVVFEGDTKVNTQSYMYFPTGDTSQRGRGRALIAGGTNGGGWGTKQNTISYIQIQSQGTAQDFGDLSSLRTKVRSVSSSSRAVFAGGSEGASANNPVDTMEYVTIATTGNVTSFGDALESNRRPTGGVSNNTRGLFGGGYIAPANKAEIDHIVIATTGSVTDYGDLSVSGEPNQGSSNSTRGVWMGGGWGAQIEYVTIASTGSGADFGDIGNNRANAAGASSSTRALCAGGGSADTDITFIQFASLGNDSDFGDLTQGRRILSGTSNGTRGIFCGGYTPDYNIIDYVDIATTGNAKDFGDLTTALREPGACSDSHGGLS